MLAHAHRPFLVFANKTTLTVAGTCGHVSAYGLLGVCAHTLLSIWVHAYFFSEIWNERWALSSFGDICGSACQCIRGYTLTIPTPHTLPYYPQTKDPSCPLSQSKTIGGGLPPSERGDKTYDCRAATPTLLVFVLIATYTDGLTRSHTWPRTLRTPLHATTLHSHLLPAHTPAPRNHPCFGYKSPVPGALLGFSSAAAKDRSTLHILTPLGKVYKRTLVVPPSSPHQRALVCGACIGTAQVGVSFHQKITRVILCRLIYIIMSFKPFNDIIMIVCRFLIGL